MTTFSPASSPSRISTADTLVAPDADGALDRDAVVDHVDGAAAVRLEERATRHHDDVRPLLDEDARRDRAGSGAALAGWVPAKRTRASTWLSHHLGRQRRQGARGGGRADRAPRRSCRAEVFGVGLRHRQLDLERRTIDQRHERRVGRHDARSATDSVPTTPSTGARTLSSSTRRSSIPSPGAGARAGSRVS